MKINIWWIRRDLRLFDNPSLAAAIANGDQIIPLYILDPSILNSTRIGEKRRAFLFAGLSQLYEEINIKGGKLIIRSGNPLEVFWKIKNELPAGDQITIYCEPDHSPYAQERDAIIQKQFPIHFVGDPAIISPGLILKKDGNPYTVFSHFKNAWYSSISLSGYQAIEKPAHINALLEFESESLPSYNKSIIAMPSGEIYALKQINRFFSKQELSIYKYKENRNILSICGTSMISPYIRFGMLSARHIFSKAQMLMNQTLDENTKENIKSWMDELVWRDFYMHILHFYPLTSKENFRHKFIQWHNDLDDFAAWCDGKTGYPIIDAVMRQLVQTGWINNRSRMIVASFLTKNLLIDWRWGEKFFMQHLIDGDPAANIGNWQWSASTGTDAAPYFRIFNPINQSTKFDKAGNYIRTWVTELLNVNDKFIHQPWFMNRKEQNRSNCHIGKDYPFPIVDLAKSRYRALNAFDN